MSPKARHQLLSGIPSVRLCVGMTVGPMEWVIHILPIKNISLGKGENGNLAHNYCNLVDIAFEGMICSLRLTLVIVIVNS